MVHFEKFIGEHHGMQGAYVGHEATCRRHISCYFPTLVILATVLNNSRFLTVVIEHIVFL